MAVTGAGLPPQDLGPQPLDAGFAAPSSACTCAAAGDVESQQPPLPPEATLGPEEQTLSREAPA